MDFVVIANHGAGEVRLPLYNNRDGRSRLVELVSIPGGRTKAIDASKWEQIKKNRQVQAMINRGFISEPKRVKKENEEVPTFARSLEELPVPEELLTQEEAPRKGDSDVSGKVISRKHRTITVD